jgi:hypothetical protein
MLLSPAEYEATAAKIDKVNARAAKRGWTGTVKLTGTFETITETGPSGLKVSRQMVDATITGEPPKYDGWTFLARAEFDSDSGLVVYGAPGACPVDRESIRPGECDHCHVNRYRKHIYIVSDGQQQLQVGSTCLKDFLGWSINPVWVTSDLDDYREEGAGGYVEQTWSTITVLAVAWAAIQEFGYVRSGDYSGDSTKYVAGAILDPHGERERELAKRIRPHVDDALAMAGRIREWVLSDQFSGPGDYVANLKNIAAGEFVSFKKFGFLVSAPQAWARSQERDLIRRKEREGLLNEWNGQPGDHLDVTVTVAAVRYIPGDYGTTALYTMSDTAGRTYKWFASRDVLTVSDTPVAVRGTVKKLDEYQGRKSTILTRVKVV